MTGDPIKAQHLLEQARIALQYKDRQAARRLAQQATQTDPAFRDAWLFMADLSHGNAQKAYLDQANRLISSTSLSPAISDLPNKGKKQSEDIPLWEEQIGSSFTKQLPHNMDSTQPIPTLQSKKSRIFILLVAIILLLTILLSSIVWVSLPTLPVSAVDHSAQRLAGELLKPSLTPTETLEPTITPIATDTPEPTLTATSEASLTPTTQYSFSLPTPEMPLNIPEGERWIDVDLTNQRTFAFEGSSLIRTFIVSTGTQYHPTITGQYRIYVKYRYTDMAGPGYYLPDVPYTMYFYKGYSLHGTYWHNNFGQPMSHGCVNMTITDSEWLYYWASVGTLVNIHY
jgi:lipoprotein-anchoring transpeptidase ErfK/SrfK